MEAILKYKVEGIDTQQSRLQRIGIHFKLVHTPWISRGLAEHAGNCIFIEQCLLLEMLRTEEHAFAPENTAEMQN